MNGAGTSGDPWQVADYDDLKKVGRGYDAGDDQTYALDDYYVLTADIDASASATEDGGAGWTPIPRLTAVFDGAGHTIDDLTINRGDNTQAFIAQLDAPNGLIKDLRLTNVDITASSGNYHGALVGLLYGQIVRCSATGSVTGGVSNIGFGGLVGRAYAESGTKISDSYSMVDVTMGSGSSSTYTGGVVGRAVEGFVIENSYYAGVLSPGTATIGGIVGDATGTITDCFWDGTVSDDANVSGGGTEESTAELQDINTYTTGGPTWDMVLLSAHDGEQETATWYIDDGNDYPRLWFEYSAPVASAPMPQYIYGT